MNVHLKCLLNFIGLCRSVTFQISSEFCMWLRNLPAGEDPTVNSLPQEYVRALFDTAQSANVAHSKIAQGLQGPWKKKKQN